MKINIGKKDRVLIFREDGKMEFIAPGIESGKETIADWIVLIVPMAIGHEDKEFLDYISDKQLKLALGQWPPKKIIT